MKTEKTKIEFDFEGDHYILEYTARSLKKLERSGVKISKLDEMIFSAPEILFKGAFFANHPNVADKTVTKIYNALKRSNEGAEVELDEDGREVDALANCLAEMLKEAVDELTGRGEQGNISWKITK